MGIRADPLEVTTAEEILEVAMAIEVVTVISTRDPTQIKNLTLRTPRPKHHAVRTKQRLVTVVEAMAQAGEVIVGQVLVAMEEVPDMAAAIDEDLSLTLV